MLKAFEPFDYLPPLNYYKMLDRTHAQSKGNIKNTFYNNNLGGLPDERTKENHRTNFVFHLFIRNIFHDPSLCRVNDGSEAGGRQCFTNQKTRSRQTAARLDREGNYPD